MNPKEKVKSLPSLPGVYLMKDSAGSIIYVGKAKKLKSRVGSYFQGSGNYSPKVIRLINNISDFDYIVTDTEFEAFMLECRLIKEIKPFYNKKMKSPLSYTYITISTDEKHPYLKIANDTAGSEEGSRYWGPYTGLNSIENVVMGLRQHCKILCNTGFKKASSCLNHSMGLCLGMCMGGSALEEYISALNRIVKLLDGADSSLLEEMEAKMKKAAEAFDYETAALYRDYINSIKLIVDKNRIVEFTETDQFIALLEQLDEATVKFFVIKGSRILLSEKFELKSITPAKLRTTLRNKLQACLKSKEASDMAVVGRDEIDEAQIIYSYIKGRNNPCRYVIIPSDWNNPETSFDFKAGIDSLIKL